MSSTLYFVKYPTQCRTVAIAADTLWNLQVKACLKFEKEEVRKLSICDDEEIRGLKIHYSLVHKDFLSD